MSGNERARIVIKGRIWEIHDGSTTSKEIYKLKNVIRSKGKKPNFTTNEE